jgi:hypothetical protein
MQNIKPIFNIYVSNFITFAVQISCQSGRPDSYRESMPGKFESVIGDLSEWSNEQAWKVCIRASVSRVRIPQSPH